MKLASQLSERVLKAHEWILGHQRLRLSRQRRLSEDCTHSRFLQVSVALHPDMTQAAEPVALAGAFSLERHKSLKGASKARERKYGQGRTAHREVRVDTAK